MDLEKMQSTMQFLLEQQAKHDVIISQHHDRMNELHKNFQILTALSQNYDERMDSNDRNTESLAEELRLQVESFRAHLQAQREDFFARLEADNQAHKERLEAESHAIKERLEADAQSHKDQLGRWEARCEQIHVAIDSRLDRLSAIVERQVTNDRNPPPG